ncbi:DNA polymerase [Brevundimonas phage vB_BpoS-Kikimora]|uniref:DNA polymerase n=1 Tax=Brevundimonas phage vB_BpoS-Kikimora TaxID=2948601 RepID=A0A9E7SL51_9CAUD|nr:DNA polymerase [Brevundimonas phage vB_BpoS-Kikimora]
MSFIAPTLPLDVYGEANIRLGKIEAEENVTILFAVESGSRAWGFPSPDSDNDVRFFYVRPLSHYLGLDAPRDVIERPIEEPWDLNGWDLGKALRLLVKGNATAMEWLSSPLIYREHGPFPARLRDLIKRHASAETSARHYYGLAQQCYMGEIANRPTAAENASNRDLGVIVKGLTTVNLKKYLYAVRAAMSIAWIARYKEVPPMTMPALMSHAVAPEDVAAEITTLLRRKSTMGEFGHGDRIAVLDEFIEAQLAWVKAQGFDRLPVNEALKAEANQMLLDALGIG